MGSLRALLRTLDRCLGAAEPAQGLAGPQQGEVVHALNVYENDFRCARTRDLRCSQELTCFSWSSASLTFAACQDQPWLVVTFRSWLA